MFDFDPHLKGHYSNSAWTEGKGERRDVIDPSTGKVMGSACMATEAEVALAVDAAAAAQPAWAALTPSTRAGLLSKVADKLEENFADLATMEAVNAGKPIAAVRDDELHGVLDAIRLAAMTARSLPGMAAGEFVEGNTSYLRREAI